MVVPTGAQKPQALFVPKVTTLSMQWSLSGLGLWDLFQMHIAL